MANEKQSTIRINEGAKPLEEEGLDSAADYNRWAGAKLAAPGGQENLNRFNEVIRKIVTQNGPTAALEDRLYVSRNWPTEFSWENSPSALGAVKSGEDAYRNVIRSNHELHDDYEADVARRESIDPKEAWSRAVSSVEINPEIPKNSGLATIDLAVKRVFRYYQKAETLKPLSSQEFQFLTQLLVDQASDDGRTMLQTMYTKVVSGGRDIPGTWPVTIAENQARKEADAAHVIENLEQKRAAILEIAGRNLLLKAAALGVRLEAIGNLELSKDKMALITVGAGLTLIAIKIVEFLDYGSLVTDVASAIVVGGAIGAGLASGRLRIGKMKLSPQFFVFVPMGKTLQILGKPDKRVGEIMHSSDSGPKANKPVDSTLVTPPKGRPLPVKGDDPMSLK